MSYRARPALSLAKAARRAPMQARLMTSSDEYCRVVASIQPRVEAGA